MGKERKIPFKWRRILLGYLCMIIGALGIFLPILQAWAFFIAGLVLLKDHTVWARWLFDYSRKKHPKYDKVATQVETKIDRFLRKVKLAE